jgi:hypothetical protein
LHLFWNSSCSHSASARVPLILLSVSVEHTAQSCRPSRWRPSCSELTDDSLGGTDVSRTELCVPPTAVRSPPRRRRWSMACTVYFLSYFCPVAFFRYFFPPNDHAQNYTDKWGSGIQIIILNSLEPHFRCLNNYNNYWYLSNFEWYDMILYLPGSVFLIWGLVGTV